jgi:molybdopterin-binding protein
MVICVSSSNERLVLSYADDNEYDDSAKANRREAAKMKISARNILKGTVKSVEHGAVNSEVVIQLLGGQEIVSIITKNSAETLGLSVGKEAYAVIKASEVMIAAD